MTALLPWAETLVSLLITYLIHSTIIVLLVAIVTSRWCFGKPDLRVRLWKATLVLPVLTSLATLWAGTPHFGSTLLIASSAETKQTIEGADPPRGSGDLTTARAPRAESPTAATPNIAMAPLYESPATARDELGEVAIVPEAARVETTARTPQESHVPIWPMLAAVFFVGTFIGCVRLGFQFLRLELLRRHGIRVSEPALRNRVKALSQKAGIRKDVDVIESAQEQGPLAGGILRPFILLPAKFLELLQPAERDALFAHELVHIARRDSLWKLIGQLIRRVFFFQPLNQLACRRLEIETEYVADEQAARLLNQRGGLAGCLSRLGEWLADHSTQQAAQQPLAAGMAAFRSTLGRRVEILLRDKGPSKATSSLLHVAAVCVVILFSLLAMTFAPRAVAHSTETTSAERNEPMKKQLATLAVIAGVALPAAADDQEKKEDQRPRPPITKKTPDDLPEGVARFSGMLVGRLVAKDVEKGTFVVNVDAVSRVWRNNKAENPKSIVGKNVEVDGVSGKWLDVLLLVKQGETLEFESQHQGGERLTFPGELLRKVAPYDPKDYPVLPEAFRGFNGAVSAKIVKKDPETFEMIVQVDRVIDTWKNNRAKQPHSIEGKPMMLAGFWRRKDQYHGLKVGDQIEVGLQHITSRSDFLTVAEFVRKGTRDPDSSRPKEEEVENQSGLPGGVNGLVGALVGRLVEKDVEKGTLVLRVDAVPRVWRNNKARRPKSIIGKEVKIDGVANRLLDVLLTTKQGETLEVAVRHDRGEHLTFLGELFRKVAPYKPEDYPVLPDQFRGFQGVVTAKIVKKDPLMYGLIAEIEAVKDGERSRAKKSESIVGKSVILAGFWRRKELYGSLKVGDRFETGLQHQVTGTDVLSVGDLFRKAGTAEKVQEDE